MADLKPLSEQLREAILRSGISRYRIAKDTGISEAQLSRFINRVCGLGQDASDQIGKYLGLRLVGPEQTTKRKSKGN
jgi:plasmid maintenance system antidote protein VapI